MTRKISSKSSYTFQHIFLSIFQSLGKQGRVSSSIVEAECRALHQDMCEGLNYYHN